MRRPICLPYTGTPRREWVYYWSPSMLFYLWEGGNDPWEPRNYNSRVLPKEIVQDLLDGTIREISADRPDRIDQGRDFRWGRGHRHPKP